jgi:hypothetical protein
VNKRVSKKKSEEGQRQKDRNLQNVGEKEKRICDSVGDSGCTARLSHRATTRACMGNKY